jgi:hypothetical protein
VPKGALVGQPKVTREGQGGLALHLVTEDCNGRQIVPQGALVAGKQRSRGDGERYLLSRLNSGCSILCTDKLSGLGFTKKSNRLSPIGSKGVRKITQLKLY